MVVVCEEEGVVEGWKYLGCGLEGPVCHHKGMVGCKEWMVHLVGMGVLVVWW